MTLVPEAMKETQEWFASIITRPLMEDGKINPIAPSGTVIAKEATRYIIPSPTLRPHQCMQIYNQQYWWRLLNTMQTNFPLVLRLFGHYAFNESIAIPYLVKYPPGHWSLTYLGEHLLEWVEKDYHQPDKRLVYHAAYLDGVYSASFLSQQFPLLDFNVLSQNDPEALLMMPFCLQPHIHLAEFEYDLPTFREVLMKEEPEHWLDNEFPPLPKDKTYHFVIFRNSNQNVAWKEIALEESLLLQQFKKGLSIHSACEWIEQLDPSKQEYMASHLQQWMQDWARFGWLTDKK